jgi:SAM-dependent methyltransferase/methyltransferase-like protein
MTGTTFCAGPDAVPADAPAAGAPGANSYDLVPYNSRPFRQTHPRHLAAVATLFGMTPAPIGRCRVLELGCASGGNLIPMALTLPNSRFVGVDLSARQIADGQQVTADLGTDNIELRHLDIMDVGWDFEPFDYIVCHGVYSWVPTPVQNRILELCARTLAPQGVAFVSYNTYPGWHMSGTIRDMIGFHARRFARPEDRANQARALLRFLTAAAAPEQSAYSKLLKEGLDVFDRVDDSYVLHEYLEEFNEPVYFHQFVERAERHGLQYLAESEVHTMAPWRLRAEIADAVAGLSSNCIETEQFLDFVRNRKFRQTLLCHAAVKPQRKVGAEKLAGLSVASALVPEGEPDIRSDRPAAFRKPRGPSVSTGDPLLKACLVHLAEQWPQAVPFATLTGAARSRLADPGTERARDPTDEKTLGASLLQLYSANLVELHAEPLPFIRELADSPVASPLARRQALAGPDVTNLRHETVSLSGWHRRVLCLLDGSRTRSTLSTQFPARDALDGCLTDLARAALLNAG